MALATECLDEVARRIEATEDEVAYAQRRVQIPDPAEVEILTSRNLSNVEKLRLLDELRRLRGDGVEESTDGLGYAGA